MTPTKHTLTPDQVKCTGPFCTAYKQWLEGGQQGDPPKYSEYGRGPHVPPRAVSGATDEDTEDEGDDWIIEAV